VSASTTSAAVLFVEKYTSGMPEKTEEREEVRNRCTIVLMREKMFVCTCLC
jgi:hypothetical protein